VTVTIIDAMNDRALFGKWFKPSIIRGDSWRPWKTFLKGLFALPMTSEELQAFQRFTGRTSAPTAQFTEAFIVAGRRAGKSRISATIGAYVAAFRDYSSVLSPGETAVVMLLAADRRQARVLMNYLGAFFTEIPILARLVESRTQESIRLKNRVVIEVHVSSYRSTRGYTLAAVVADEISFWPADADSANPASETLNAVRPGLATIPGSLLLAISSPYSKRGPLYEAFRDHYGKDDSPILVWRAPSQAMNPTINPLVIGAARFRDSVSARTEYDAEFRGDLESLFSAEIIEQRVVAGRRELPPISGTAYCAFIDPSGGVHDGMVLAVAHEEKGVAILDSVREIAPPFSPEAATKEFAEILRRYHLSEATGDRYGAEWVTEAFEKLRIRYRPSEKNRSELYLEFLPVVMSAQVELLDNRKLVNQLVNLERRTGRARDVIDHGVGQHDDLSNAAAGVCVLALGGPGAQLGYVEWLKSVAAGLYPFPEAKEPSPCDDNLNRQRELELGSKLRRVVNPLPRSEPVGPCPECGAVCRVEIGGCGLRCGQCGHVDASGLPKLPRIANRNDAFSTRLRSS
jgi:hypothetical protein